MQGLAHSRHSEMISTVQILRSIVIAATLSCHCFAKYHISFHLYMVPSVWNAISCPKSTSKPLHKHPFLRDLPCPGGTGPAEALRGH